MKREIVAISVIVLLVFTVLGTAVATAKPANSATITDPLYTVTPGVPSIWVSPLFNYQYTNTSEPSGSTASTNIFFGKLTATSRTVSSAVHAYGYCEDGVTWYLNPRANWDAVKDKPVLVKAVVSYTLVGSGKGEAGGDVWLVGGQSFGPSITVVHEDTAASSYSVHKSLTTVEWNTTLSTLATQPGQGHIFMFAGSYVTGSTVGTTQSATHVTVYSIELQWLSSKTGV